MSTGNNSITYGYARNNWYESYGQHIHFQFETCWSTYGACPKYETCAFSEGLTDHCTGAGGVGYEKILDWPPWKEPLPKRAWLTTPQYPPVGPVLWTSQIAPILQPVFFRFLGLKVCNAKAHVLTGASMRGVPNRVFLTGGYMAVFFTLLLVRWCPFLGAQIVSTCLL